MKTIGQMQAFLGNGDQHVCADCDPDLRLDRILAGAQKRFDSQVLLDPFEEQLDLPTLSVQVCNQRGLEREVVGQKRDALSALVLDHDATQRRGIVFARVKNREHADLIAHDIGVDSVDRSGVPTLELGVGLGPGDEKGTGLMDQEQPSKIEITPIQQIVGAGFDLQVIQGVDLVHLAVADVDERRNRTAQVQQCVQLDRRLVLTKRRPRIHRQTQIDGGCIEGVHSRRQIDSQRLLRIQSTRHRNQMLCKVGVNLPRARGVGVGQGVARDRLAAQAHVIQPLGLRTQVQFDIAQRLAIRQLGKSHRQELIHAGKILDLVIAPIASDAATKSAQRQKRHQLRKDKLALVHGGPLRTDTKDHKPWARRSNRDQT